MKRRERDRGKGGGRNGCQYLLCPLVLRGASRKEGEGTLFGCGPFLRGCWKEGLERRAPDGPSLRRPRQWPQTKQEERWEKHK